MTQHKCKCKHIRAYGHKLNYVLSIVFCIFAQHRMVSTFKYFSTIGRFCTVLKKYFDGNEMFKHLDSENKNTKLYLSKLQYVDYRDL